MATDGNEKQNGMDLLEWLAIIGSVVSTGATIWEAWQSSQEAEEKAIQAQQAYYTQERLLKEQLEATERMKAYICYGILGVGLLAFILSMRRG